MNDDAGIVDGLVRLAFVVHDDFSTIPKAVQLENAEKN
jgi:hypothetical protein